MSREERKAMIRRGHPDLSLGRQCRLLSIGRSSFYYEPKGESAETLALMRRIDELFLKYPFYGSRQMARQLRREGVGVGRHRVRRLMRLMGLEAIYQAPRTSTPHPEHRVYPYLLKGLAIERPDQVWCADITYIPVQRGFLYLVAIMDWATRHVLAWRLSNTLDAGFCVEALQQALTRYGRPEIFNSDQGSQFTSLAFTGLLTDAGVAISMDGRGRCMDNIFIERLWRSLKYEAVYLHELTDGFKAERVIAEWIDFYKVSSQHTSRYIVDGNRLSCLRSGPAGCLAPLRVRSSTMRAADPSRSVRRKSHGPSARGWRAWISPRSAARRRVFGATPTVDAACVRLSQGSRPSSADR
jgi:putative transposase